MKNIAIIGGGISGVSMAYFLDKLAGAKSKKINIDIIEKSSSFAKDKISNFQFGQEIYDNGWHNKIYDNGLLFQLMLELGLYRYLIKSKETQKVLYTKEGFKTFPEKMLYGYPLDKGELLQSDILTLKEKMSVLMKLHKNTEVTNLEKITVEKFFNSKINNYIYEKIIEPLLTSHYGSDISKQNFSLLMPELAFASIQNNDVESVVNGMYKNKKEDNIIKGTEYRLKFTLRSFLENLESYFSDRVFIEFDSEVTKVEQVGDKYKVTYGNKTNFYDYVIVSVKNTEFLNWFKDDRKLQRYYKELKFNSNIVLTLVVKKENLQVNSSIGEIIFNKEEDVHITKIEYVSNKWIDIKAKDIHLIRIYVNRQEKVNSLIEKTEEEIAKILLNELELIHDKVIPEKCYVTKAKNNYMNIDINYSKYIHEIGEYLTEKYKYLYFIGNSKKATTLEKTIEESKEMALAIIEKII